MKKINYDDYMVFPYTFAHVQKKYDKKVFEKYGDQLCFLYQNGYDLSGNTSLESIDEQMWLFNNFESYEDLEDLRATTTVKEGEPVVGLKIVDSVFYLVIKRTSWGIKKIINIKAMGDMYRNSMYEACCNLNNLFNSKDSEIVSALKFLDCDEIKADVKSCFEAYEKGYNNIMLVKYQRMYMKVLRKHWDISKRFLSTNDKGLIVRMGNINDEMYGTMGCYNPQTNEIKVITGSAVSDLYRLVNGEMNSALKTRMNMIAKECKDNGETDKTVLDYVKGNRVDLEDVRKALAEITFKGIMVLATLKYGITLAEDDTQNSERAGRMMKEIKAICDYTGFFFSEV